MQTFWALNKLARLLDWLSPKYVYFALTLFFIFMYTILIFLSLLHITEIYFYVYSMTANFSHFFIDKNSPSMSILWSILSRTQIHTSLKIIDIYACYVRPISWQHCYEERKLRKKSTRNLFIIKSKFYCNVI